MTRTMVIKSESFEEDAHAAKKISKEMACGDSKKIVWFSSLGKEVEELKDRCEVLTAEVKRLGDKIYDSSKKTEALMKEIQSLSASKKADKE